MRSIVMSRSILVTIALFLVASTASAQALSDRGAMPNPVVPASALEAVQSEAHAKAAIEARGYSNVRNLHRDPVGNWAGEAVRGGVEIAVVLQLDGDIAEE